MGSFPLPCKSANYRYIPTSLNRRLPQSPDSLPHFLTIIHRHALESTKQCFGIYSAFCSCRWHIRAPQTETGPNMAGPAPHFPYGEPGRLPGLFSQRAAHGCRQFWRHDGLKRLQPPTQYGGFLASLVSPLAIIRPLRFRHIPSTSVRERASRKRFKDGYFSRV